MTATGRRSGRRTRRSALRVRSRPVVLVALVALVAFLYYSPIQRFAESRSEVADRRAEVAALEAERARRQARLQRSTSLEVLRREARRIGYVAPGEQLFIVKGIKGWQRAQRETPPVVGRTLPDR